MCYHERLFWMRSWLLVKVRYATTRLLPLTIPTVLLKPLLSTPAVSSFHLTSSSTLETFRCISTVRHVPNPRQIHPCPIRPPLHIPERHWVELLGGRNWCTVHENASGTDLDCLEEEQVR
jgi:hypothetical protein